MLPPVVTGFLQSLLSSLMGVISGNVDMSSMGPHLWQLDRFVSETESARRDLVAAHDDKNTEPSSEHISRNRRQRRRKIFERELEKALEFADEAKELKDRFDAFQKSGFGYYLNVFTRHSVAKSAADLKDKMVTQRTVLVQLESKDMYVEPTSDEVGITRKVEVAMEVGEEKKKKQGGGEGKVGAWNKGLAEKLWGMLKEDSKVGLVAVHGMGGVGKTMLLNDVYNRFSQEKHGFKVMMIQVEENVSVKSIQEDIYRKLELHWWPHDDEKKHASEIFHVFTQKQRYVILLDDVWHDLPLESIGIPSPKVHAYSCKVVFATRISSLCGIADETIVLRCLPQEESWALFQDTVGRPLDDDHEIKNSATKIVEECEGLPLALVAAAQALSRATTASEWKRAAADMKQEPWKVEGMEKKVLSVLRRSYDFLSSDALRVAFAYFTFYPKGTTLERKWLTDYWIGEGLLKRDFTDMNEAGRERDQLIEQLECAGLVERMHLHSMVRAMANYVGATTGKWLAMPEAGLLEAPPPDKWEPAERMSLIMNKITIWPDEPSCPNLVTLLLWKSVDRRTLPRRFFQFMSTLRVLELCSSYLKELPPSIGELRSLQFLDLSNSDVERLPETFKNLVKLLFLNLQNSVKLKSIPHGIFQRLTELRVLRMDNTYSRWGSDDGEAGIDELRCLENLVEFDVTIENAETLAALAASTRLQTSVRSVNLRYLNGAKSIQLPRDLGDNMKRLHWLRVSDCEDLEELVFDGSHGEGSVEKLRYMDLERLPKVKLVWKGRGPRECLRSLKELRISECARMEELVGGGDEAVLEDSINGPFAFPNLHLLYLIKLSAMRQICRSPLKFPSLSKLWVDNCPGVMKLPFGAHSGGNLSVIWGSRMWWNDLEWPKLGGELLKSNFDRVFVEW